jgi:N-methylhydantoinase A
MRQLEQSALGIDVGGTFTDAVLVAGGGVYSAKLPSTSERSIAVMQAAKDVLAQAGLSPGQLHRFVHGMTVATNALLERKGARVVCVLTEGFRDLLVIDRQQRDVLYSLYPQRRPPLVPRERSLGARERVGPEGVRAVLTREEAERVTAEVAALDPEAVAVCLLWSFRHPEHEQLLGEVLARALPNIPVVLSSELAPLFREFERASTTVVDAYVTPRTRGYLEELGRACRAAALVEPEIMQSSGGAAPLPRALAHAGHLLLSGPAGGVLAARSLGDRLGLAPLLTFDMGGTSTDCAALPEDGNLPVSTERRVADQVVRLPMADIHTVSAGGGSIAWIDEGGALKVGPESAGADPGPACYGRGGTKATVTDADVVLGRISLDTSLGGLQLQPEPAREAIARLAERAGLGIEETAEGILRVAVFHMAAALRKVTVERGVDPRSFSLLAFGGAGGLHACALADELRIRRVVVPVRAGVLSALGLASAPGQFSSSATVMWVLDPPGTAPETDAKGAAPPASGDAASTVKGGTSPSPEWREVWNRLEDRVTDKLASECVMDDRPPSIQREAEVRYRGQSHELSLTLPPGGGQAELLQLFHDLHEQRYGYRDETIPVEVVTVRVTGTVDSGLASPPGVPPTLHSVAQIRTWLDGRSVNCPVLVIAADGDAAAGAADRDAAAGAAAMPPWRLPEHGPALISDREFTLLVQPGWRLESLPGALLMTRLES